MDIKSNKELHDKYITSLPVPHVVIDDFLPSDIALQLYQESCTVPDEHWTTFTRNNSLMKECIKLNQMPVASKFVNYMHSNKGIQWLEELTGIKGIISDPFIVGAGYSKSWKGDSLKVHTDFNWNDQLKVHRVASLIIYLTPDWKPEYKGAFEFWDFKKTKCVKSVDCLFNRAIIWNYHKKGFHGYPEPLQCPDDMHRTTFRLMFYVSNSTYLDNDRPHRSLYWYDRDINEPYDIPTKD